MFTFRYSFIKLNYMMLKASIFADIILTFPCGKISSPAWPASATSSSGSVSDPWQLIRLARSTDSPAFLACLSVLPGSATCAKLSLLCCCVQVGLGCYSHGLCYACPGNIHLAIYRNIYSVQWTGHSESAMVIFAYRSCFGRWQADRVICNDPNGALLSFWINAN